MKEKNETDPLKKSFRTQAEQGEEGPKKTIRQRIADYLKEASMTGLDISQTVGIREKAVYDHLPHIARSVEAQGDRFVISPAQCLGCGYCFRERRRVTPPSRCPKCKGTHIQDPSFEIQS